MYNEEKYVAASIESVIAQTFLDWELIIVDDDSTDDSLRLAQSYQGSRIKVYRKKHAGLSAARNFGLNMASGEYIYFLDADDWIAPELIQENVAILQCEHLPFIIFGYHHDFVNQLGNLVDSHPIVPERLRLERGCDQFYLDGNHLDLLGYAWNKLYRRSFLIEHRCLFEHGTSLVEDILFNTSVFSQSEVVVFNDRPYYHYVNRPTISLIKRYYPDAFELVKRKFAALSDWMTAWEVKDCNAFLSYAVFSGLRYCLFNLFGCRNELSSYERKERIKNMISDPLVFRATRFILPDSVDMQRLVKLVRAHDVEQIYLNECDKYHIPSMQHDEHPEKHGDRRA